METEGTPGRRCPDFVRLGALERHLGDGVIEAAVDAALTEGRLRPSFPGGVFFLDLFGMSPRPMAARDALRLLLRALGVADKQVPGDIQGRASLYRSLLRCAS